MNCPFHYFSRSYVFTNAVRYYIIHLHHAEQHQKDVFELQKEILTKERIDHDVKRSIPWRKTIIVSIAVVIMALFGILQVWMYMITLASWIPISLTIIIGGSALTCIVYVFVSTYQTKRRDNIDKYQICVDRLEFAQDNFKELHQRHELPYNWALIFPSFGVYRAYKYKSFTFTLQKHYTWSKTYTMTSEGLFNTALPGDTFYIVTTDNKTILEVYNTKFFEYADNHNRT